MLQPWFGEHCFLENNDVSNLFSVEYFSLQFVVPDLELYLHCVYFYQVGSDYSSIISMRAYAMS